MTDSVRRRLGWRQATVTAEVSETVSARSLVLDIAGWSGHVAGQHVDVRLTADDGYQATRSYSLSSGPCEEPQITVERVDDGEVSPYLVDDVEVGDTFELRGPVGGYFVWEPERSSAEVLLIGGGSGIAPLRAIWRSAAGAADVALLYSVRSLDRLIFADELAVQEEMRVSIHLTRQEVDGYEHGHIAAEAIATAVGDGAPSVFVCGPTAFVEAMAQHLLSVDVAPSEIRTERFG